jgi:8-amino-7-oxononanoate synthase
MTGLFVYVKFLWFKKIMVRFEKQLDVLKTKGRHRSLVLPNGIDLTSNDYLGLARSDVLRQAAMDYFERGGDVGAAGSRLLRGHREEHAWLEIKAAQFFQSPAALYFSNGFAANLSIFAALCGRQDVIIYDEFLHASARDGIAQSHAKPVRVTHNNLQQFEDSLKRAASDRRVDGQVWVAVESVYSMDGDAAPLDVLFDLAEMYDAWLIVDEAHATGVIGDKGRGVAYRYGYDRLVSLHTCGKALGVAGGLVCGSVEIIDVLINAARPFIYSTAPMPVQAVLVEKAIEIVGSAEGDVRRELLRRRCVQAQNLFGADGSQIVPIVIGADSKAVEIAQFVKAQGYDVRAVRPPTVPEGTARLRVSLSSDLKESDLQGFADIVLPLLGKEAA